MPKKIITKNTLPDILHIIDTWEGKLTWSALCSKVTDYFNLDTTVTRQSLSAYQEISIAYSDRKEALSKIKKSDEPQSANSPTVDYLQKKVNSLEADVARLRAENDRFKQRFVVWQHNAYQMGINIHSLDDAITALNKPFPTTKGK